MGGRGLRERGRMGKGRRVSLPKLQTLKPPMCVCVLIWCWFICVFAYDHPCIRPGYLQVSLEKTFSLVKIDMSCPVLNQKR